MAERDLPVISLFSGALGLDLGLERAGFRNAVAVECNPRAAATIRKNRPDIQLIERKLEEVGTDEILAAAGLRPGDPAVVTGGPSCQTFSTAGQRASLGDPRGGMFRQFLRVVREARPRFFVMENVKGLLSAAIKHRPLSARGPGYPPLQPDEELGSAFRQVVAELKGLDYYVIFDLLNAADYGVPQVRERLVFLGSRDGEPLGMPGRTHSPVESDGLLRWVTLRQTIGELKEEHPAYFRFCPSKEKFMRLVPEGGNWRDLPKELRAEALGRAYVSWGGRVGFFRRLASDKPSPALTTRPDSKATMLCHPSELRPLTIGEYAKIQQFPADWEFEGSVRQQYEQVGNAVPLGLGHAIGQALRATLRRRTKIGRSGCVECSNLSLLLKMAKRPRTVVNPPRMRREADQDALKAWYNGKSRLRDDAWTYAAPELIKALDEQSGCKRRHHHGCSGRIDGHGACDGGERAAEEAGEGAPRGNAA